MACSPTSERPRPEVRRDALAWSPWLALAAFLVATGIVMIRGHWTPISDNAMITSFGLDVFGDTPLVGMPTSLSVYTRTPIRHAGPLPFWLVGPPARALGAPGYGVVVASVAVNVLVIVLGAAASARLRPRILGPLAATFGAVLVLTALGAQGVIQPFNPFFGVMASFVAMISVASVLGGNQWGLPIFVATGSLAAQAHLTYLPLVGVLCVFLLVSLAVDHRRRRADGRPPPVSGRVLASSVALGLVLWSGPLLDQAFGTGNLLNLLQGSRSTSPVGWRYGAERMVDAIAPRAFWTTEPRGGMLPAPSTVRWAIAALFVAVLLGAAAWAARTRQRLLLAVSATALVSTVASLVASARLPTGELSLASPVNRLFWWPVGCMVWLAVATAAVLVAERVLVRRRTLTPRRARTVDRWASVAALVACTAIGVQLLRSASASDSDGSVLFGAVRAHAEAIDDVTPKGGTVRLEVPDTSVHTYPLTQGLIAQLRLLGMDVQLDVAADPFGFFRLYQKVHPAGGAVDVEVFIRASPSSPAPPAGASLLSTYDPSDPPAAFRGYDTRQVFGGGGRTSRLYVTGGSSG